MSELAKILQEISIETVKDTSHLVVHKAKAKGEQDFIDQKNQNLERVGMSADNPEDYKVKRIQELEAENQELQKYIESNLELENFAYIASHDLKAPLRTVMSFSQLMKKNHYSGLDEKGKQYLDIISTASQDMICLIDDLLKYSEISSTEIIVSDSNIETILQTVAVDMKPKLKEVNAELSISSMPGSLNVDKQRVYQLFSHIIDNSIKFRKENVNLIINITSEELKDHWLFKVSDNGEGIPSKFSEKAFELFKKHKTSDNKKGTGVGLTLSRAIVRHHDGKIWVESNGKEGNVTCFLISKNLQKTRR